MPWRRRGLDELKRARLLKFRLDTLVEVLQCVRFFLASFGVREQARCDLTDVR